MSDKLKIGWVKGNGISEWESEIYEQITKQGVSVTGICSDDNIYPLENVKLPLMRLSRFKKINRIPIFSKILQYFLSWDGAFLNFNKNVKNFDILHTSENFNPFAYQCVKSGKPTVTTIWENIPFVHERGRYKLFKDVVNRKASHFIAVSEYSKRMLMLEGVPESKISVIFHGIDINRFKPMEKDKDIMRKFNLHGKKVLLSIGSLAHGNKGTKELLYSFKLLNDKNLVLMISGKGRLRPLLQELAKKLGIQKQVIFIDGFPYSQIERLYSVCDIFVLPSFPLMNWDKTSLRHRIGEIILSDFQMYGWQEQFGYVLVEAMACGKPVVSTFCGAIPEVVENGKTGLLVTPGNYYELTEALRTLLSDLRLRDKMGRAGRTLAESKYDSRKVAKKFIEVYKKVLRTS